MNTQSTPFSVLTLGWSIAARHELPGSPGRMGLLDSSVASVTREFTQRIHPNGLYLHQAEAINRYAEGKDVCLATGTASGKTTLFHAATVEELARDRGARVLCFYPTKALALEQLERWRESMARVCRDLRVELISGDVNIKERAALLRRAKVLVATPDVIHAWAMPQVATPAVRGFFAHLRLVVLDEAHTYSGVFGSQSAYLIRRVRHVCGLLGASPRFVAASATIAQPTEHLRQLTGCSFSVVDETLNGALSQPTRIEMVTPGNPKDLLGELTKLMQALAQIGDRRFICFVDSRKQVELISTIVGRGSKAAPAERGFPETDVTLNEDLEPPFEQILDQLQQMDVLPYRSGYEKADREAIQSRLQSGALKGVVSTSALELGLDIKGLTTAILVGVPLTSTIFRQRIGRVGRHQPGEVFVINTGSVTDQAVFADPDQLLKRPPAESNLYLDNERIQYINALCLARTGGEHDTVLGPAAEDGAFESEVEFPAGFLELCQMERTGQLRSDLISLKQESGEDPNRAFPLRDVEASYRIFLISAGNREPMGVLSHGQMMREAYPGAIYWHLTIPYRVIEVNHRAKEIRVVRAKHGTTTAARIPTKVRPNLVEGSAQALRLGSLTVAECPLQIFEYVNGFTERRGSVETKVTYPHLPEPGLNFTYMQPLFQRNYFTSGVVIHHPCLMREGVERAELANLVYEAMLLACPFERADLSAADDRLKIPLLNLEKDQRFLAIYDSTYGSLRLSARLLNPDTARSMLAFLETLANQSAVPPGVRTAALEIAAERAGLAKILTPGMVPDPTDDPENPVVILPGSYGLLLTKGNELFLVERVNWNAKEGHLAYRGRPDSLMDPDSVLPSVHHRAVVPVPGESKLGTYLLETGEVVPLEPPL